MAFGRQQRKINNLLGRFVPYCHTQTFVEVAKLELHMSFFLKQVGIEQHLIRQEQTSNRGPSSEMAQQGLTSIEQKIAGFEKRLNYKAQPLSEKEKERLDTKFHNALKTRRWVE